MPSRIYIYYNGADLTAYRSAVEAVGAVPLFSTDLAVAAQCDGLLLPGGGDIDPARYGQSPLGKPRLNPERERAEFSLLESFVQAKKPVLGICLGLQMINVAFGGSLQQLVMHHGPEADGKDGFHSVRNGENTLLAKLYGADCTVNSYHRQAVDRLGEAMEAIQWAADGVIEGICHKKLPILGVQWHPERISGTMKRRESVDGLAVFHWFAQQMEKKQKVRKEKT